MSSSPDFSADPLLDGLPERYEVSQRLGQGGMATVYRAFDAQAKADVALKVLHPHLRGDPLVAERFRREIAAVRRINHPNVVAIHDIVSKPLALVMAYHPGIDLKRIIRRRAPLPVAEVMMLAGELLAALGAAHRAGIIHRDIKPHNILVDDQGRPSLTDFGLARVDDLISVTTHTLTLGTPEYMAPELLESSLVDGRADLYSLGATLYECLTGKLPFVASSPMELVRLHAQDNPPDPRQLVAETPAALAQAIMRAMRADPDDRFATAAEMLQALRGEVAEVAPLPGADPCPSCQAPIPHGLTICPECGNTSVRITQRDGAGWGVKIKNMESSRPWLTESKAAKEDSLTFQQKHALIDTLKVMGAQPEFSDVDLDMRLRTMPVMAADKLAHKDAVLIERALGERQIPVELVRPGWAFRAVHFAGRSRALAYALGTFVTAFILIMVLGLSNNPVGVLFLFLASALLMGLAWSWYLARVTQALTAFTGKIGHTRDNSKLSDRARVAFETIRSPRLRQLARRILTRGLTLQQEMADAGMADANALGDDVEAVMTRALELVERVSTLEAELAVRTPAEIHESLQRLQEKLDAETDMDAIDGLIRRKVELTDELAQLDVRQAELSQCASRLLETSASLAALRARLGAVNDDGQQLSTLREPLTIDVESHVEVHEAVHV